MSKAFDTMNPTTLLNKPRQTGINESVIERSGTSMQQSPVTVHTAMTQHITLTVI